MRKLGVFGVAVLVALTGSDAPQAQTPATNQRVWSGTWEEHDSWEGTNVVGRSQAEISYVYVEGRDEFGLPRWDSRRLTWSAVWEDRRFDQVAVIETEPGLRGSTVFRYRQDILTICKGGDTLELGPGVTGGGHLTPEQKAQLLVNCVTTYLPRDSSVAAPPPTPTGTRELLQVLGMPNEEELTGCAYEKAWPKGSRPAGSFSVSVSAPVAAVMEVDPDLTGTYGSFVPVPGETLTFVASVPSGEARFRFELDPQATSHFPGYATNANIDDMFFVKYNLGHLRGRYANDGPDMIFDGEHFGGQEWSRIEPLVVETRIAQGGAVVTVTAMDYGAVGKLRAFVKSEECGDWQPVPVRFGRGTRESIAIPLDDDNNLMADALEVYRGRDTDADDDAEPKGNGMAGDGLTAFEEYRGFMIRGATCPVWSPPPPVDPEMPLPEPFPDAEQPPPDFFPGLGDEHIRTTPRHKNLFVHTQDPELGLMVEEFAWATDLSVHVICEPHYVDNDTKIINFTLQQSGFQHWGGKRLTQGEPQHGVYLEAVDFPPYGLSGVAEGIDPGSYRFGPPKFTRYALVYKSSGELRDRRARPRGSTPTSDDVKHAVVHELSHAVGVPHHSDRVENWRLIAGKWNVTPEWSPFQRDGGNPQAMINDAADRAIAEAGLGALLILGETSCEAPLWPLYRNGQFAGCGAVKIARRGQQNSGDFMCPMRYVTANYYEPPGSAAVFKWTGVVSTGPDSAASESLNVDAWDGSLRRYRNDLDRDGTGKLCVTTRGTEINALRGDRNHAGDAGRDKPCVEYLVVNDLAARGVQ